MLWAAALSESAGSAIMLYIRMQALFRECRLWDATLVENAGSNMLHFLRMQILGGCAT